MRENLKRFWHEEDGMGTVEIVIIIAVLVTVALIFKDGIQGFVKNLMDKFFNPDNADLGTTPSYTPPTGTNP
ncbi:MAG: Flp1 family type IVb pilin [Dysosmobacter sp.]